MAEKGQRRQTMTDRPDKRRARISALFDDIAPTYDFLNHFLSLGADIRWRKKAVALLSDRRPKAILDVATGTGDFAIALSRLRPEKITGVDIAQRMLDVGRQKLRRRKLQHLVELVCGDSEQLPFADNSFDAVTVAFGVRNFEHTGKGLKEMHRVLKPGGMAVILEFSKPVVFPVRQLYRVYFRYVLPYVGRLISRHGEAYSYLPESVMQFPEGKAFLALLEQAGFRKTEHRTVTFGIAAIYTGEK